METNTKTETETSNTPVWISNDLETQTLGEAAATTDHRDLMRYLAQIAYCEPMNSLVFSMNDYSIRLVYSSSIDDHLRIYNVAYRDEKFTVVALRGTRYPGDVFTDLELVFRVPLRFRRSQNLLSDFFNKNPAIRVIFTGHSLGAAEAQYLAVLFGAQSLVFENPGSSRIIGNSQCFNPDHHLTYNNTLNLVNYHATFFTSGPIGRVLRAPETIQTRLVDVLFSLLFASLIMIPSCRSVCGILTVMGYFVYTCMTHSIRSRNSFIYAVENPATLPPVHLLVAIAIAIFLIISYLSNYLFQ